MMLKAAKFHHIGVCVRNREEAVTFLSILGYSSGETILDPLQNVKLTLCTHPSQPPIELVEPTSNPGPLDRLLRNNTGFAYHCCYRVENSQEALKELERQGIRAVTASSAKPSVLFLGSQVSFYQILGFGLVEFLEPINDSGAK
jgi:hypothetical protein